MNLATYLKKAILAIGNGISKLPPTPRLDAFMDKLYSIPGLIFLHIIAMFSFTLIILSDNNLSTKVFSLWWDEEIPLIKIYQEWAGGFIK